MITSMANSKVKRLAALAQKAKARREENCFVAEGIRMFREAPRTGLGRYMSPKHL